MKQIFIGFALALLLTIGFNLKAEEGDWLQPHEDTYRIDVITVCDVASVIFAFSYEEEDMIVVWDFADRLLGSESPYEDFVTKTWKKAAEQKQVFIYEASDAIEFTITGGLGCPKGKEI